MTSPEGKSDITAFTVESGHTTTVLGGYSTMTSENTPGSSMKVKDDSQFVKNVLEDSNLEHQDLDFTKLRREIESVRFDESLSANFHETPTRSYSKEIPIAKTLQTDPSEVPLRSPSPQIDMGSADGSPVPISRPAVQEDNEVSELLQLKQALRAAGLPDLPLHLSNIGAPHKTTSVAALQDLSRCLIDLIFAALEQDRRKSRMVNELEESLNIATSVKKEVEATAARKAFGDESHFMKMQDENDELRSKLRSLTAALKEADAERNRFSTESKTQTRLADDAQLEVDQLRHQLAVIRQQNEDRRNQALEMVEAIRAVRRQEQSSGTEDDERFSYWRKRPNDAKEAKLAQDIAADVAQVCGEKIEELEETIRVLNGSLKAKRSSPPDHVVREEIEALAAPGTRASATEVRERIVYQKIPVHDSVSAEEYNNLKENYAKLSATYAEVLEKNELLELKLLSTNPALDDEGQDRKGLSTKELIRRDKKRFRHIKKEDIEAEVPSHQAQHLLNSVCAKLDIPVMNELMSGVDDIVRAIRLIPQMQKFIKMVDAIVWAPPKVLNRFISRAQEPANPPHKLSDTLTTLESWRRVVERSPKSPPRQAADAAKSTENLGKVSSFDAILGNVAENERTWDEHRRQLEQERIS